METGQNKLQVSVSDFHSQNDTISDSSLPRSINKSGEFISVSPLAISPGKSPARRSSDSDLITIIPSSVPAEEHEKLPSPGKILPLVVVKQDACIEPAEDIEKLAVAEEPKAVVAKTDTDGEVVKCSGGEYGRQSFIPRLSMLQRTENDKMVKKAALGFRIFGFLFCLVSFSVMTTNINQGWALDSFYRYKEFRYCMSVSAIGILYSAAQAVDLSYNLATGKHIVHCHQQFRHYFDFAADQMISYLLISASSSAAIRVDDWQSNWGKDKFPAVATASISGSFLGFLALAISSLISGYMLCTSTSKSS
ncbi:CASP-like protein 4A1 [Andrographis paniculata]|uniref:CASP-like protein 4A1 n=1 Tax=Andrographis paniculata TaxID=175694 RepID=UPI0021E6DEB6|nr:CASP-like protein 4A1 [Andrographis paniculata]XP_051120814.1 CASP-like protein 4A1 [Andrographis paniculata]XP_051120823.1 CASP-like protein 4A1 [Andrographis paniculata]